MSPQQSPDMDFFVSGPCPGCGTQIELTTDSSDILMLICEGCGKGLAMHDGRMFMVRASFLEELNRKYRTRYCGEVTSFDYSTRYRKASRPIVCEEAVSDALCVAGEDCLETIKRLSSL